MIWFVVAAVFAVIILTLYSSLVAAKDADRRMEEYFKDME